MSTKRSVVLVVWLSSCGQTTGKTCTTECGIVGQMEMSDQHCDELQKTEMLTLWYLSQFTVNPTYRLNEMCDAVDGYHVFVRPERQWEHRGVQVSGTTYCGPKEIYIATTESGSLRDGSLTHELAHAVQDCVPVYNEGPQPKSEPQDAHWGWEKHGISNAVNAAKVWDKL